MENANEHELLTQFMDVSNKRLESYAAELKRLNETLVAAFEAMKTQAEEIVASRDVVIRHEKELAESRELITKVVKRVFGDPAEGPSSVTKARPN